MLVKIITPRAGQLPTGQQVAYAKGDLVDLPEAEANRLIERGKAERPGPPAEASRTAAKPPPSKKATAKRAKPPAAKPAAEEVAE